MDLRAAMESVHVLIDQACSETDPAEVLAGMHLVLEVFKDKHGISDEAITAVLRAYAERQHPAKAGGVLQLVKGGAACP